MVAQDAETFVALGRAVTLAGLEGALESGECEDLAGALVAGILSGSMDLETYARVHEALAQLLERAFEGPVRELADAGGKREEEPPLGVYLEVVGEAWDKVSWDQQAGVQLREFVRVAFDLSACRFGNGAWFRAALKGTAENLAQEARRAGLLVVSISGILPAGPAEAALAPEEAPPGPARIVLRWGDRRVAVDLFPA